MASKLLKQRTKIYEIYIIIPINGILNKICNEFQSKL